MEIGRQLFDRYPVFLEASEALETLSYQVEDARACLTQNAMILSAVRGQIERLGEADEQWRRLLAQPQVIVEDMSVASVHQIEDMLNVVEQQSQEGRYEEALRGIDQIH